MEFWKTKNVNETEKSYAHKAQTLVKLLEIMSALILVFWSTIRLPVALNLLIEFLKQTSALLLTTPSVFLIGNAIVVTLFAQFQSLTTNSSSDLYHEFVSESRSRSPNPTQEIEKHVPLLDSPAVSDEAEVAKCCRRTQSERVVSVARRDAVKAKKELRRSKTGEKCRMKAETASCDEVVEDELSGDEFKRRVEAFIEKQQRFIRDENMALVLSS